MQTSNRENSNQLLLIGYYLLHCIFSQHPYYIIQPIYPTSLLNHSAYLSIALTAILFIPVMIFITVNAWLSFISSIILMQKSVMVRKNTMTHSWLCVDAATMYAAYKWSGKECWMHSSCAVCNVCRRYLLLQNQLKMCICLLSLAVCLSNDQNDFPPKHHCSKLKL